MKKNAGLTRTVTTRRFFLPKPGTLQAHKYFQAGRQSVLVLHLQMTEEARDAEFSTQPLLYYSPTRGVAISDELDELPKLPVTSTPFHALTTEDVNELTQAVPIEMNISEQLTAEFKRRIDFVVQKELNHLEVRIASEYAPSFPVFQTRCW